MPASKPGSLTPDEVYALVAFLFYRNGIIQENDVLDAKTSPEGRDAEPGWLRSGSAGVSPGSQESQVVVSASGRGIGLAR